MDLGVFIPIGNNGWLISTTSPQYKPSFELNLDCVQRAEKYGFEFNKQYFSIVKLEDYYYFFLNQHDRPVYVTHTSQMLMEGNRFGFYVEPGIMIRCDRITIKRIVTDKNFKGNPWMPIGDDEMPLGSEILRG